MGQRGRNYREDKSLLSKYIKYETQHAVEEDECWQNQRQIYACNTDSNARQEVMKVSETGLNLIYISESFGKKLYHEAYKSESFQRKHVFLDHNSITQYSFKLCIWF